MWMSDEEIQSKSIDFLRFPLIVGVIFIHNYSPTMVVQGVELGNNSFMPFYHVSSELFSRVLGNISVPLFFVISGFLFFLHTRFNKNVYLRKLRSRMKSLLIPYLFWNIAFLLLYYIVSRLSVVENWLKGVEYTPEFILSSLWGRASTTPMTYPIAYQFWFIRDLMVVVALTPLMYLLIKYTKVYGLGLFGVLWYLQLWPGCLQNHGLSSTAWFFFYLGAWLSINEKNLVKTFGKVAIPIYIVYPVIVIWDLYTKGAPYNYYIAAAGVLIGIPFFFNLTSYYIGKGSWKTSLLLSGSSFFVFAIHDPWLLSQFRKIGFKIFQPQTDGVLTFLYFVVPLLVTLTAVGLYILLRKYTPSFIQLVTGRKV